MAKSLGINIEDKTDVELRQIISSKFGSAQKNSDEELKENKFKN